jgi:hypothetical protein
MNASGTHSRRRLVAARLAMVLAAAFLMLAMHETVGGASGSGTTDHGLLSEAMPVGAEAAQPMTVPTESATESSDAGLAAKCGLAIMCVAALAGVGAFLMLRGRNRDSALWIARRAQLLVIGFPIKARLSLTTLQRTSLLRC